MFFFFTNSSIVIPFGVQCFELWGSGQRGLKSLGLKYYVMETFRFTILDMVMKSCIIFCCGYGLIKRNRSQYFCE